MENIFAKFNETVDLEGIKSDIGEAKGNDQKEFKEVPHGAYEVAIDKMELVMTKSAPSRPMLSVWMRVLEGEFKNSRLFYNQTLMSKTGEHGGMMIGFTKDFLESLESGVEIAFEDFEQYSELILDVMSKVEGEKEYALDFEDNNGFDKFTITQVFDKE